MNALSALLEQFKAPSVPYRSIPFWAWNDQLDKEELVRQLREMKAQGMGGAFLHSREGLETVYMGPEWMDCVRETVKACEELGLHAWLYDEDRWPSGFAGGMVQARGGDAFRAKGLELEVRKREEGLSGLSDAIALFKAVIDGRALLRCERLPLHTPGEPGVGEVLLVFREKVSERSEWFNNEAPPDNLNPETVQAFIDITYEAYKREIGESFGTVVKGVFTDEPSVHDRHCKFTDGRGWLPWTWSFPAFFQERRGYDFLDVAPYLYFDGELSAAARHDFWRTVTERFSESYSKQLGDWCGKHGLAFTGHYLWENNLGTATRTCGAVMPNYRFQHVPGIDMLQEQTDEYITVKQCASVANQYGRKFVITETYGCTGWGFTFEGQKWIGDFQYVLGVNLRSQHLALYSIKGCRKRDYPPVINYNTSWWKYNHVTEDYFARLSAVLTEGRPVRDVLVLHPSSTAWSMLGTGPYGFPARGKDKDVSALNHYGDRFNEFLGKLLRAHYDFDLGDEIIMSETGEVRGAKLGVNLAEYEVVLLPEIRTMLRSTYELLMSFLHAGGKIVAVGEQAAMLEGRPSPLLEQLYGHVNMRKAASVEEAVAILEHIVPRKVSLKNDSQKECPALLCMLRELEDSRSLFVVNNDRDHSHHVTISMEGAGQLLEWDALTGEIRPVEASGKDGFIRWDVRLGPADSRLYVLDRTHPAASEETEPLAERAAADGTARTLTAELGPAFRFTRTMPNVLTLDTCAYRLAGGEWSEITDVWRAQRDVREALGMRQIYGNGQEQRYKWIHEPHPGDGKETQFKFTFYVSELPRKDVYLVLEQARYYDITLNGQRIAGEPEGWFLDRAFDKVCLRGLQTGVNELILSCRYLNRMEVEDCYLIGDFGVSEERTIVAEPETLTIGDWCSQGYYHYCGSMIYYHDLHIGQLGNRRRVLELGECSAVTVELRVNGAAAGHIPWRAADGIDITEHLKPGSNRIEIEVMSSPRNMLGPFHGAGGEPKSTSWASFRKEGDDYTPDYKVRPYGLLEKVRIYEV